MVMVWVFILVGCLEVEELDVYLFFFINGNFNYYMDGDYKRDVFYIRLICRKEMFWL